MAGSSDSEGEGGPESRSKMLKRHKKELIAAQKAAARLGKKRADEGAALVAEVNARHAAELTAAEAAPDSAGAGDGSAAEAPAAAAAPPEPSAEAAATALAATTLAAGAPAAADAGSKKPSKAQQRRAKLAKEEAEREQRIAEEKSNMGDSSRVIEENALMAKLAPMQLTVRDIKADGHCLYRSLEDQLSLENGGVPPAGRDYLGLRAAAASYMRRHPDDYAPFVVDGDAEDAGDGAPQGADGGFERYCAAVECTAAWGGQLELRALSHVLRRRIAVYSAHLPTVEMGTEYADAAAPPLRVAYQQHAYGLGEHYNSVVAEP